MYVTKRNSIHVKYSGYSSLRALYTLSSVCLHFLSRFVLFRNNMYIMLWTFGKNKVLKTLLKNLNEKANGQSENDKYQVFESVIVHLF